MATNLEYIKYVCDQITLDVDITYKKMFGEYIIYLNAKPVILVCDNTIFLKIKEEINDIMKDASKDYPYEGAKLHYTIDPNDSMFNEVLDILEKLTPIPKKRKR